MQKAKSLARAASVLAAVFFVGAATSTFAQSARVAGFRPSKSGLKFANSFPSLPYMININGINISIGDASNGMCGGMVYTVRDYFEAGMPPPPNTAPPGTGPLFNHLSGRLFDSFNLPGGPGRYLELMSPAMLDHETDFSRLFGFPRGRAWKMIVEEWPVIKSEIDHGRLAPLALVRVKNDADITHLGRNHQVLAYAYALNGNDLKIYIYDPNHPKNDKVTVALNISDPNHTTAVTQSTGETIWAFFLTGYGYHPPPAFAVPATKLAGDFNGDGKTDVALAGGAGWNTLPVAFSAGSGTFSVTNAYVGDFASWAADRNSAKLVGDFNGDGKADVALTGPGYWRSIPTALSNGTGSFAVTNSWVGDFGIWSGDPEAERLVGDFNGDGKSDIALTGPPWWNTLPVAFSNGNGDYSVTNTFVGDFATWSSSLGVTRLVGDFNGDGRDDIALTGPQWSSVPVAFSNGDGSFYVANSYVGDFATWSADNQASRLVGDFNGDGLADIALTGVPWLTSVPVAFSDGAGGFIVTNYLASSFAAWASFLDREKVTGDFNGDGRTDIAVRPTTDSIAIAYSNGNGTFNFSTPSIGTFGRDVFNSPQAMLLKGDFTGDGRTDLALTGPLGWLSIPLASPGPTGFTVTNGWVGDFGSWASEPIL